MNAPHRPTPIRALHPENVRALVPPGGVESSSTTVDARAALLARHVAEGIVQPEVQKKVTFNKARVLEDLHFLGEAVTLLQKMHLRLALQVQTLPDDLWSQQVGAAVTATAQQDELRMPPTAAPSSTAHMPENQITDFGFRNDAQHPRVVLSPEAAAQRTGLAYPTAAAPVAEAPRPTLAAQVSGMLDGGAPQPTAEANRRAEELDRNSTLELRKNFSGSGSLFARYLSPDVILNGKGALKPGRSDLGMFEDDVSNMTPDHLLTWPIGFYRNRRSAQTQFLLHSPSAVVIVDGLPNDSAEVTVHILRTPNPGGSRNWYTANVNQLSLAHLMQLTSLVETVLQRIPTPTVAEMSN